MDVHESMAYSYWPKIRDGRQKLGILVLRWDEDSEVSIYCGSHVKGYHGAEKFRFGYRLKTEVLEADITETSKKMQKGDV